MKLSLLTATVTVLAFLNLPFCAQVSDVATTKTARKLAEAGGEHVEGQKKVDRECKPMRTRKVPFQEETSLGGAVAVRFVSGGGNLLLDPGEGERLPETPANTLNRYLNRVGKNLAAQSERPTIPWTFGVMRSQDFNAVSAPGGYVFVAAGLLKQVDNEAQLAGVLAHEIAHITQRHAMKAYGNMLADKCESAAFSKRNAKLAQAVVSALDTPEFMGSISSRLGRGGHIDFDSAEGMKLLGPIVDGLADVLVKGYSHEDEFEADRIAAELLVSAGYNPEEYVKFLSRIPASGGLLTSHPDKGDRQAKLRAHLTKLAGEGEFGGGADFASYPKVKLKNELKIVKK